MDDTEVWEAIGAEGFGRISGAFYKRVKEDGVLGPMYPEGDWEGSEARLRGFLLFRFGGVMDYVEERGHPRLRARHMPFAIGEVERDRWVELMGEAVREAEVPGEAAQALMTFFAQVADFMRNR
ncbi:MAG: globin [Akkermansiaceae bacterium]|jgi:hemoglobin|nr:globin [Akkermansiaceae bacterium]